MRFADPWLLSLLVVLPLLGYLSARRRVARLPHPTLAGHVTGGLSPGFMVRLRHLPRILRVLALALLVVALARPQQGVATGTVTTHGVDILIALDTSGSMTAQDFAPDRLEVAKEVVGEFVQGRPNDRLGLVVFAANAFTQVPLTLDHRVLLTSLERVKIGLIEDGTAIGAALATAVGRLADSDAASRVVVLLTDGINNRGQIDPLTAADMAAELGIRVYTIGVGREGRFVQMQDDPILGQRPVTVRTRVDEGLLKDVAKRTGGRFFRARDEGALRETYRRIDELEKSPITSNFYMDYRDRHQGLLISAFLVLLVEWTLSGTRLRRVPG